VHLLSFLDNDGAKVISATNEEVGLYNVYSVLCRSLAGAYDVTMLLGSQWRH